MSQTVFPSVKVVRDVHTLGTGGIVEGGNITLVVGAVVGIDDESGNVGGNDGDGKDVGAMLDRRRTQTTGLYMRDCVTMGDTWHALPGEKQEMLPADALPAHPASLLPDSQ